MLTQFKYANETVKCTLIWKKENIYFFKFITQKLHLFTASVCTQKSVEDKSSK